MRRADYLDGRNPTGAELIARRVAGVCVQCGAVPPTGVDDTGMSLLTCGPCRSYLRLRPGVQHVARAVVAALGAADLITPAPLAVIAAHARVSQYAASRALRCLVADKVVTRAKVRSSRARSRPEFVWRIV